MDATVGDYLQRSRWVIRNAISRHQIFLPMTRLHELGRAPWLVAEDTAICIDGYPRSATTFATAAFQIAQPAPVRVAHHTHAPAQIVAAVQQQIPTLVSVRPPRDAVLSVVVYLPYLEVERALGAYVRFYEALLPYRRGFVVGRFDAIANTMDEVVGAVNARFGTAFTPFEQSAENVEAVFGIIEGGDEQASTNEVVTLYLSGCIGRDELRARIARGHKLHGPQTGFSQRTVARPSAQRSRMKAAVAAAYDDHSLSRLRRRAERLHDELTTGAPAAPVAVAS